MLLCDHIVFWMRHNELPVFENKFEWLVYDLECSMLQLGLAAAASVRPLVTRMAAKILRYAADSIEAKGLEIVEENK